MVRQTTPFFLTDPWKGECRLSKWTTLGDCQIPSSLSFSLCCCHASHPQRLLNMNYLSRPQDQESQVIGHPKRPCADSAAFSASMSRARCLHFLVTNFIFVSQWVRRSSVTIIWPLTQCEVICRVLFMPLQCQAVETRFSWCSTKS